MQFTSALGVAGYEIDLRLVVDQNAPLGLGLFSGRLGVLGPLLCTLRLRSGQAVKPCPDTERKATADPSTSVVRRGGRPPLRMTSSGSGATARGWETLIPRFCRSIPRSAPGGTSCGAGGEWAKAIPRMVYLSVAYSQSERPDSECGRGRPHDSRSGDRRYTSTTEMALGIAILERL